MNQAKLRNVFPVTATPAAVTHGDTNRALGLADFAITETTHAPDVHIGRHIHRYSALTFVLRGAFQEDFGGGRVLTCRPLSVMFKPAAAPHSNRYSSDGAVSFIVECTGLGAGGGAFLERGEPQQGFVSLVPLMIELHRAFRTQGAERAVLADELAERVVRRVNALGAMTTRRRPAWLSRVEERVRQGCRDPLRLSTLARDVNVHPVYLARVFRRHVGRSIGQHMIHCRLELAMAMLAQSHATIPAVALEAGFSDQSHLTHLMAREIRTTPARFRRLVQGHVQAPLRR